MSSLPPPGRRTSGVIRLYKELWQLARGSRRVLVAACALLILAQVVLLGVPYVAARAINALQTKGAQGLTDAGLWLSSVLLLAVASWTVHGPARLLERNLALQVRRRLSTSLLERLFALPLSWHEANHSGATAHRVQQSTHAMYTFAESQFIYLNSAVRLIGPVVALWCIDPVVGAVCIAGFVAVTMSVVRFDRAMIRLATLENNAERKYAATLVDALGNTTTVFALRQAKGLVALLERRLFDVFKPLRRAIVLNEAKWFTVDLATRVLSGVLVGLFTWRAAQAAGGGSGVKAGLMLGSVYMVWEYAVQASGVVVSVAEHFQSFARQHADYASADVIRDAEVEQAVPVAAREDGHVRTSTGASDWSRLNIDGLCFRHPSSREDKPTLDRISISLERGKSYALVGDSGCGKSTLLRVLAGLYPAERLSLQRDRDVAIVSPAEGSCLLRKWATLIPQDAEVFAGTLAENLELCALADGTAPSGEFSHALRVARADFVSPVAACLDVEISERGGNWSGGQRSRIALARGVLAAQGSGLVLLDEPTAHLDATTEGHVYASLFAEFGAACIVSSVHRLHLLDRFDEIIFMNGGRVVAQGPLDLLLLGCSEFGEIVGASASAIANRPREAAAA